jgi:hypothetical protein
MNKIICQIGMNPAPSDRSIIKTAWFEKLNKKEGAG